MPSQPDLVITNGRVVTADGVEQVDLCVADGRIVALIRAGEAQGQATIDAADRRWSFLESSTPTSTFGR